MSPSVSSQRVFWIDFARTISIIFVIFIHNSSSTLPPSPFPLSNSWFAITLHLLVRTGVPIFFMLSGALLLGKDESTTQFLTKRVRKILIPWVLWTLIYSFYVDLNHQSVALETAFLSMFWFIPIIFILYLFMPIVRSMAKSLSFSSQIYFFLLWFIFVSILPVMHPSLAFPASFQSGLFTTAVNFSGYLFLGYFLTQLKLSKSQILLPLIGLLLSQILSFLQIIFLTTPYSYQFLDYFSPGIVILSLSLFLLIKITFTQIYPSLKLNIIQTIGQCTFGIFLIQELVRNIFSLPQIFSFPLLQSLFTTLTIFSISFIVVFIIRQTMFGRYLTP